MSRTTKTKTVYLAYTKHSDGELTLLKIYAKSSYQTAYNWLADIADRHGKRVLPCPGTSNGSRVVQTYSDCGQIWYLESHEVA